MKQTSIMILSVMEHMNGNNINSEHKMANNMEQTRNIELLNIILYTL